LAEDENKDLKTEEEQKKRRARFLALLYTISIFV
jgi:hypothetical protein